jgi:pyridoxine 4-dehydrogenase
VPIPASDRPAAASGTLVLGGDLPVTRLGFGSMRLTGPGVWGDPPDRDVAIAVLRRAVELGVDFIDTADAYGPSVSEDLIAAALHPYAGVTIATKGGFVRPGPNRWYPLGFPAYLRQSAEMSLRRLRVDTIDLYQLHRIDPKVPVADQLGELEALRQEGKIARIGLSEVSAEQVSEARLTAPVVSVQNQFSLLDRKSDDVLAYCEREGLGFIPWNPIAVGRLAEPEGPVAEIAEQTGYAPVQVALAWLLRRSPAMLPIPGTGSLAHLEENVEAAAVELTDEQFSELSALS